MIIVAYPEPQFKIKKENSGTYIFDAIRRSWLLMTDEEWVRQNFVSYLIESLKYPSTSIALEKEIILNDLKKRFDILVYNKEFRPWLIVECKGPNVPLSEDVLQQALRYNITVPVQYIIITNGHTTIGWKKESNGLKLLNTLPEY
ncbi:MAG: type I restriction enzyme HsdR N-terminal domain-containing protein [Flavisolibacter sp.]